MGPVREYFLVCKYSHPRLVANILRFRCFPLILIVPVMVLIFMRKEDPCICVDVFGIEHDLCYGSPENNSIRGTRFSCEHVGLLHELGLLSSEVSHLKLPDNPVFVTAFSQSHYMEGQRLIGSIRQFWKHSKIVVYDIGLSERYIMKIKNLCNVELRRFRFEKYPEYFADLTTFRWKPIVIAESSRDFGTFWYMDSSVILTRSNLQHVQFLTTCEENSKPIPSTNLRDLRESSNYLELAWDRVLWSANLAECKKSRLLLHSYTGHGIFAATDPEVFRYFPSNMKEVTKAKAKMYEAGLVFIKTDKKVRELLKWYVLCALVKDCMGTQLAPNVCQFDNNNKFQHFAHCHRYDQSVLNVLLANANHYDRHYYTSEITDFFRIQRYIDQPVRNSELKCSR